MDGGGGFEIWQFTSRNTEKAVFNIQLGDYGMIACKIKSRDVHASYKNMIDNGVETASKVLQSPEGKNHFFVKGPNGNMFEVVESKDWFSNTGHPSKCGGVAGSIIGVSDIDKSLVLYKDILGYDQIVYDQTDSFNDLDSSDTFDMGEAGGRFSYVEDPDGTWIEFVETHKVPILKKIGWYIHLKKRKPGKSLPRFILKMMGLNRVKD